MRRFVTVDVSKATVADGLLTVSSQWLSRAGLTLDVSRGHSFILGAGGQEEFYIAVSKGETNFKWSILRTIPGGLQVMRDGDCAADNAAAELELNYSIATIRDWQGGELPDDEPDPEYQAAMSIAANEKAK
jgi:hypothetical protein